MPVPASDRKGWGNNCTNKAVRLLEVFELRQKKLFNKLKDPGIFDASCAYFFNCFHRFVLGKGVGNKHIIELLQLGEDQAGGGESL